jgi:hypothetical protein
MSIDEQMDAAMQEANQKIAERLYLAITFLQVQHMQRVSKPAVKLAEPRWFRNKVGQPIKIEFEGSKPGEYPRLRTGHGRAGVVTDATTPEDVVNQGMVARLGQLRNSWYMLHLEIDRNRLGYIETAKQLAPQVRTLILGTAS